MTSVALSELLGAPVSDSSGAVAGRVREVAVAAQDAGAEVTALIVSTRAGQREVPAERLQAVGRRSVRAQGSPEEWAPFAGGEGLLLLERDLLDQQVIDVHGRKVVRVNDVEFQAQPRNGQVVLTVSQVEVGARGAVRRLLKGLVPAAVLHALLEKLPARGIPWQFVNLIETDPARRVKLKISHERLAKLHPADIADILEELAPAEREAVFDTLDEETAAETLEEIDPKMQVSLVESLDHDRAADIVEEMDPDAAADLMGDLSQETAEEILEEMQPEERQEVSELLEFEEHTAAGRMNTDVLAVPASARAADAIEALRRFEGAAEIMSTVYLVEDQKLVGAVPLTRLVLAGLDQPLAELTAEPLVSCPAGAGERDVIELFDKYNLLALPVVDEQGNLTGVITADDVITLMRGMI